MRWLDFLFPPRADESALKNSSIDNFLALVAPHLVPETRPGTAALLSFSHTTVRAAVHEAKYHGSARAYEFLGSALAEYLRDADTYGFRTSVIVPVPLGAERLKERGFNQVHEVILRALRILGEEELCNFILEPSLLVRTRETTSQVSLPRHEREKNMRGAFACPSKLGEHSRATFIIIDDVITTGATLQAAIDALKEAGAKQIIPLALAH